MNYNELKRSYDNARREQLAVDKEIRRINKEIQMVDGEESALQNKHKAEMAVQKSEAVKAFIAEQARPYEQALAEVETKLQEAEAEYAREQSENSFDNLMATCSSKQDILEEVKSVSSALQGHLSEILGENMYEAVNSSIEGKKLDLIDIDLGKLVQYFNSNLQLLDKYGKGPDTVEKLMGRIESVLTANDESQKVTAVIAVGILVVALLFHGFAFPVYLAVLILMLVYHVMRNYRVYRIAIVQKAVKDNVDQIEEHLKKQIEQEVQDRAEKISQKYEPMIDRLTKKVASLKQSISDVMASGGCSFQFDDTEIKERMQAELEQNSKRKSALLVSLGEQEKLLKVKTERVNSIAKDLNGLLQGLQEKFLFGVGKDVIFNPNFLFDIDTAKRKPEYFVHPEVSCLFLYDTRKMATDFVRLLSVQLRSKLNPFSLSIMVVDTKSMGKEFVYFTEADPGKNAGSVYSIIANERDEMELIGREVDSIKKRQGSISRGFHDIKEYNQQMITINSLTESYEFIFMLDPKTQTLQAPDMDRIIRNGPMLGVYTHVFMELDEFAKLSDARKVLEQMERVYLLQDGRHFARAKDYIVESVLPPDK